MAGSGPLSLLFLCVSREVGIEGYLPTALPANQKPAFRERTCLEYSLNAGKAMIGGLNITGGGSGGGGADQVEKGAGVLRRTAPQLEELKRSSGACDPTSASFLFGP